MSTPPPTPEPQAAPFRKGRVDAWVNGQMAADIEKNAKPGSAATVTTIDGAPVAFRTPARGDIPVGQLVSDEDLRALGEEPLRFPVCEVPGCKGEGRNKIFSSAGKPLSINRNGELVFGDPTPVEAFPMTQSDKTRAMAQSLARTLGTEASEIVIGPSGQVAQQVAKSYVDVCEMHRNLPHAKQEPKRRFVSGPFASYLTAKRRAASVGLRTRVEPAVFVLKMRDGSEAFYVKGDDGVRPPRGIELTDI